MENELTIKAKDFATELTSHNVTDKDLKGEYQMIPFTISKMSKMFVVKCR